MLREDAVHQYVDIFCHREVHFQSISLWKRARASTELAKNYSFSSLILTQQGGAIMAKPGVKCVGQMERIGARLSI